jgi:hypothetical protein
MYYRIRYTNNAAASPKNIWYQVTTKKPQITDTNEIINPIKEEGKAISASLEGSFITFELATMDIPDEYEDDGKGKFIDPRPVVSVEDWLSEDAADIIAMSESIIDLYIQEQEEEADIEGVILKGDIRKYVLNLRSLKKKS